MEFLSFHTEELPEFDEAGARYVVVAYCGSWRDGEATSDAREIPRIKRELRKRFMLRLEGRLEQLAATAPTRCSRVR